MGRWADRQMGRQTNAQEVAQMDTPTHMQAFTHINTQKDRSTHTDTHADRQACIHMENSAHTGTVSLDPQQVLNPRLIRSS